MIFTASRLAALAPHISVEMAAKMSAAMETILPQFGIGEPLPRAHFLAQACYESQGFTRLEENLNYTAVRIAAVWPRLAGVAAALAGKPVDLANAAYARRNGNGSEGSGDGWMYRGRGLFQLTGRNNYDGAARALAVPFVGNPDLVAQPQYAVMTAAWFWKIHGGTNAAIADDAEAVTVIINGQAREGLTERRALTEQAKAIFT